MIEVKMYLYDALEINLMSQFEAILQQKRAQAGEVAVPPQPQPQPQPSTPEPDTTPTDEQMFGVEIPVNAPPKAPAPAAEVDDVTIQRTITAYGQKHGVPATVAKMQELFGVSQASKVPAERRAEFVEAFAV